MTGAGKDWWRAAFAEHYSEVYHHRDDASAAAEIAGLLPRLRAAPGPVLDACCGGGRHLAAMRAAGLDAYGFDFSAQLIAQAQARKECAGRVVRGDMRAPPFTFGIGAITLLFTAFGYFDDAGNAACLNGLGKRLLPGGWLILDLPNRVRVQSSLISASKRITPEGFEVDERRALRGPRVEKTVVLRRDGEVVSSWLESVRLYEVAEVSALAAAYGLQLVDHWPGLHGPDMDEGRSVCWLRRLRESEY